MDNLLPVSKATSNGVSETVNELIVMLEELLLAVEENSDSIPEKFREVGAKANLMLLKGELILHDSRLQEPR